MKDTRNKWKDPIISNNCISCRAWSWAGARVLHGQARQVGTKGEWIERQQRQKHWGERSSDLKVAGEEQRTITMKMRRWRQGDRWLTRLSWWLNTWPHVILYSSMEFDVTIRLAVAGLPSDKGNPASHDLFPRPTHMPLLQHTPWTWAWSCIQCVQYNQQTCRMLVR